MTKTRHAFPKAVKAGTRAIPLRANNQLLADVKELAETHAMKRNGFLVRAVEGIMEMINAPEGKIPVPELVAVIRLGNAMRKGKREFIKHDAENFQTRR